VWHNIAWRSKHQNVMPIDISSLPVVGTSVFLVPLTFHWKNAADIGSPS
jgi:hypothetical protein